MVGLQAFIYGGTRRRLGDEYAVLSSTALASMLGSTPDEIRSLRSKLPAWTLILVVAGYNYLPEEKMAYEEKGLAKVAAETGVTLKNSLPGVDNDTVFSLLESAETGVSWKRRLGERSVDIFFVSTLDKVPPYVEAVREVAKERGFSTEDLGVYIQPTMQGRTAHIEFNLPHAAEEREKATVFHDAAVDRLLRWELSSPAPRPGLFQSLRPGP